MHNKTDIDLIFESYNQRVIEESKIDFDALFNKKYDRMPESQDEVDSFLFDVLNIDVSNGVSKAELISKYGEDAVATYERFGEENDRFEGPFEGEEDLPDFPALKRGQQVHVTFKDGSELSGSVEFDGPDLGRSNAFTLDGKEHEIDEIVYIEPVSAENDESGSTVYVVQSDAEYEDTQVHGIFTDFETAKEYAAEVELPTGFWVGVKEMPLNKPEAQGKYHRLS